MKIGAPRSIPRRAIAASMVFLVALAESRAAPVTSTWTAAGSSNWGTAGNWSNGVPNNGADTYTAVINTPDATLTLNLPVTISTLTLTAGRIFAQNQTLSVLGQSTFGPGTDGSIFNSP